jgi:uncharacterized protein (TIGR03083 family)
MEKSRYLDCLAGDYRLLRSTAISAGLTAPVPSCAGWSVADLVTHVGQTYLHKVAVLRDHAWPRPWPPAPEQPDQPDQPAATLDRGYRELAAAFAAREPGEEALTFFDADQTVGFWIRRMAQETVIHRIDAELAAGGPVTPVPADLAVNGIDELLRVFLAGGMAAWPEDFENELEGGHLAGDDGSDTVVVTAGDASWTVCPRPTSVTVAEGADAGARAVLAAPETAMLRWLWGRAGDAAVTVTGDPEWASYLRRLLVVATQ